MNQEKRSSPRTGPREIVMVKEVNKGPGKRPTAMN